jgi:hypothetical protein
MATTPRALCAALWAGAGSAPADASPRLPAVNPPTTPAATFAFVDRHQVPRPRVARASTRCAIASSIGRRPKACRRRTSSSSPSRLSSMYSVNVGLPCGDTADLHGDLNSPSGRRAQAPASSDRASSSALSPSPSSAVRNPQRLPASLTMAGNDEVALASLTGSTSMLTRSVRTSRTTSSLWAGRPGQGA